MLAELMDANWFPYMYLTVLICTVLVGIGLSYKLRIAESNIWKSKSLVSAIIGFFSLLLAFTLSSSSNSDKSRTNFMQQHRGALANLYRQSFLFDDSLHRSVKDYILKAIDYKLAGVTNNSAGSIRELDRKASILNNTYMRSMSVIAKNNPAANSGARAIADAMNKIIDLDAQVHYSNQERTPAIVMMLLLLVSWAIGLFMGISGVLFKNKYYLGPIIYTCLTSLTVLIIQDMDNPHQGLVRPPYDIYMDLMTEIKAE